LLLNFQKVVEYGTLIMTVWDPNHDSMKP
jgi:hypothetical protein